MKPIRIVSICTGAHETKPRAFGLALREAERLVREAGRGKPDLIVLPEVFAHAAFPVKQWAQAAEDLRGETCARFGRLARQLGAVIVCPLLERVGDRTYNAAVFIAANGRPLGSYHKMIPTIGEMEAGISPSSETVVVDTPVGRLGALICFDLNFVELMVALRQQRPDIVFFPSMFRGGLRARYLALECACYVVVGNQTSSQLINPLGRLLNKAGARQESFAKLPQYLEDTINLNYGVYHLDYNMEVMQKLRNQYAGRVRLENAQAEGVFLLESLDPRLPIERIEKEFKLEPSLDYYDRARAMARTLSSRQPLTQPRPKRHRHAGA